MEKERLIWVDSLKGWLMILVIIGHAIQNVLGEGCNSNHIWNLIYSFHMPAFMAVSGWMCYRSNRNEIQCLTVCKRRFYQLLLPYFLWSSMLFVLRGNYCVEQFNKMILYPDSYLWFLWVLFWINVLFTGAQYVADKFKIDELSIILTTCILLLVVMVLFELRMFGFQFLAYYFLFYTLGYCVHRFKKLQTSSLYVLILLTALWFCLAWFWTMHGLPSWMPAIPYVSRTLLQYAYRGFTAIVAIYVLLNVSPLALSAANKFNTWISKVGILSLGIYVSHCILSVIFVYIIISHWIKLPVFFNIVVTSIISFVVAWVTVNLLAKNKYTTKYFLGKL